MSGETKKPPATVLLDALEKTDDSLPGTDSSRHIPLYLLMRSDLTEGDKERMLALAQKILRDFPSQAKELKDEDVTVAQFKEVQAIAFFFSGFAPEEKEST